jgi:gliding motility-associatede transport system auxiliary component
MRKPTGKIISSIIGAIFVAGILIMLNALTGLINFRIDLTENSIYTLSDASKKILSELNEPITFRFYFSRGNNHMPIPLKNFAARVEDLLLEYKQAGKGNIHIEKFDPEPFSDAEDSAIMDGVSGQQLTAGDKIYLGLAISCGKKTVAIPFISPKSENLLEYKITSAITEVFRIYRPTIGVMSALPVTGGPPTQEMIKMGIFKMSKPWLIISELKKNFDVINVPINTKKIGNNIDLLLIIHPAGIADSTEFAIDQFILKGGNVVAFLDPLSFYASTMAKIRKTKPGKTSSTLKNLLKVWNLEFSTDSTVADAVFARKMRTKTQSLNFLTVLDISKEGITENDVIASQLNALTMIFAGSFAGTPPDYLKKSVLLHSTADSCKLSALMANNPQMCFRNFSADPQIYDVAIRLTGKFKTAFKSPPVDPEKKSDKDLKDKKEDTFLKEGIEDAAVILVADSDILYDEICVKIQQIFNQKVMIPINDNLNFAQNIADSMCGDKSMIGIRCRPVVQRPFDYVKKMQADAEKEYKKKILELEKKLRATQDNLNRLQKKRTDANRTKVLSAEQQQEMKNFKKQQVIIRKELKNVQKQFRKKIDALENKLKWFNIALLPLCILIFGITVAIYRKQRNSAK